jgi:hypothetical protein
MWRSALVIGLVMISGMVTAVITSYIMLRVDPSTVLSSCSGANCSPPVNPWSVWLPGATGILGMAMVGIILILRRRGILGPIPN